MWATTPGSCWHCSTLTVARLPGAPILCGGKYKITDSDHGDPLGNIASVCSILNFNYCHNRQCMSVASRASDKLGGQAPQNCYCSVQPCYPPCQQSHVALPASRTYYRQVQPSKKQGRMIWPTTPAMLKKHWSLECGNQLIGAWSNNQ